MNRFAKLVLVAALTGASLGHSASPPPASAAAQPGRYTGPITVNRHDYTLQYRRTVTGCMAGDTSWASFDRCTVLHPDTGGALPTG
jgi:hypothetical protein